MRSHEQLPESVLLQVSSWTQFVATQKGPIVLALRLRYILIAG